MMNILGNLDNLSQDDQAILNIVLDYATDTLMPKLPDAPRLEIKTAILRLLQVGALTIEAVEDGVRIYATPAGVERAHQDEGPDD